MAETEEECTTEDAECPNRISDEECPTEGYECPDEGRSECQPNETGDSVTSRGIAEFRRIKIEIKTEDYRARAQVS